LRQRERVLNVDAWQQTHDCPVPSTAHAAGNALRSISACSVPPVSRTDSETRWP
jgi:hypothetical protein